MLVEKKGKRLNHGERREHGESHQMKRRLLWSRHLLRQAIVMPSMPLSDQA